MSIKADRRQAKLVFTLLLALYRAKRHPYDSGVSLPQAHIPSSVCENSLSHALYLFFGTHLMRGRIKSDIVFRELAILWQRYPELFVPASVARYEPQHVQRLLNKNIRLVPSIEIPAFWVNNAQRLTHWGGDPRNLFSGAKKADELRRRMMNPKRAVNTIDLSTVGLLGFQEKMVSMLAYFLMDAELIKKIPIAPAVDFHLMRVMINLEIPLVPPAFKSPRTIAKAGVGLIEEYLQRTKEDPVALGDALWLLSRDLCSKAPGEVRDWTRSIIAHYLKSCADCPVANWCEKYVPSDQYYRRGGAGGARIIEVRERTKMPSELNPQLLFHDLPIIRRRPDP